MIGKPKLLITKLLDCDQEKFYEIKEHKEKRSLNANSYLWVLINKMANVLRISKQETYLQMLKSYGQSQIIALSPEVDVRGYFKYYEYLQDKSLNETQASFYKIFKGSSEFDSKEMAILIDGVVFEASNLGIETKTPKELEILKKGWQ